MGCTSTKTPSLATEFSPQTGSAVKFQLLASFWVQSPHREPEVTAYELYRWLLSMCTVGGADPIQFWENKESPENRRRLVPSDTKNGCTPLRLPDSPRAKNIDIVENAMILRGDVHPQFDDYEFAFSTYLNPMTGRSLLPRLCTFERDGAPSIRKDQIHYLQRPETDGTPDVDQILYIFP
ncbi:hypothetical protein B0H13DRAFT_2371304 [Mycena leptocephala]|nr:hypothetical protein B0H13DRAFT_2371304 [Mycena leptocephala]